MRFKTAFAVLAGVAGLSAQAPVGAQTGPAIGTRVPGFQTPEFQAIDQHGTSRTLASTLGPQGGLLVFFRSADW